MNKKHLLLFILGISTLSFILLNQSLSFGLNGDDWQALYFYITRFTSFQSHFDINNYSTNVVNYTFSHILMGIIYKLFSFNPYFFYLSSLIFRIIAALSFSPAVYAATKDKRAAILSTLFFATMFTGIETTNWVFNMNTYIAISVFNYFIFLYFNQSSKLFTKNTFFLSILIMLSFFASPTRMHGLLFAIPIILLMRISNIRKELILFMGKCTFFLLPLILMRFLFRSINDVSYLKLFIQPFDHLSNSLINLFATLANSLIIDNISHTFFNDSTDKAIVMVGFYLLGILFFYKNMKKFPALSKFGLFSISCTIAFTLMPWFINPTVILPTNQRYLIIPGSFMLVTIAIFCSILSRYKNIALKSTAITLPLLIILINSVTVINYFDILSTQGRLAKDSDKNYEYLRSQINKPNNKAPLAFLFLNDDAGYLYNSITFGFSYHWMLIDPRFIYDIQQSPFPADNMDSLINVLSGPGSSELNRYGYNPIQIPLENVYVFEIKNKQIANITAEARKYLKTKLPHLN